MALRMALKMAILKSRLVRGAYAAAFAAAVVVAPAAGLSVTAQSRTVADPCTQVNTNGSVALQCGAGATPGIGGYGGYGGGCTTPYGTYQNCIVQQGGFPPASRR